MRVWSAQSRHRSLCLSVDSFSFLSREVHTPGVPIAEHALSSTIAPLALDVQNCQPVHWRTRLIRGARIMWNKDEVKGAAKQVKGKAEQTLGRLKDDGQLEGKGQDDEIDGRIQQKAGEARRAVGDSIEKIGKAIKR